MIAESSAEKPGKERGFADPRDKPDKPDAGESVNSSKDAGGDGGGRRKSQRKRKAADDSSSSSSGGGGGEEMVKISRKEYEKVQAILKAAQSVDAGVKKGGKKRQT